MDVDGQGHDELSGAQGIRLALFYESLSGTKGQRTYVFRNMPQSSTVTIRLEPFGERSLPNTHIVYTRFGKEFKLSGRTASR